MRNDFIAYIKQCDAEIVTSTESREIVGVGVDVPNAGLMLIENEERLGLAQLQQLRGRVGRGSAAWSCVLLYPSPLSAMARERLAVMCETSDGFVIAESELELCGPGALMQRGLALAERLIARWIGSAARYAAA